MRCISADSLCWRLLVVTGVVVLLAPGCSRNADPPPPENSAAVHSSATPAPARTTQGEIAGVRYLEHMTGGARADEWVPMIVALHPMGGDPADFLEQLRHYRRRARLILPYGHPHGGMYVWYDSVREDIAAPVVTQEADRIAAALVALVSARPTVGKPLVTGFSQGGIMTFAMAVTHPEILEAAFPIGGMLPPSLYPSAMFSSVPRPAKLPPVVAFHGSSDLAVPTQGARASIAELLRAGYRAELREYAGVVHDISGQEMVDIFERLGQSAARLEEAAPGR